MVLRISVYDSKPLFALVQSLQGFDKKLLGEIRKATRGSIAPEWQKAVAERADTRTEQLVLAKTARVVASNQNVTLKSAHIGRSLSGGLSPSMGYAAVEFGADNTEGFERSYTAHSTKGKSFTVKRHTRRQLRPSKRTGYAVYPAAAEMIPRFASLWVQTTVRLMHDIFEGK